MDALITKFLTETSAVQPAPNPDFNPAKYRTEDEDKARIRINAKPDRAPKTAPATGD